MLNPKTLSQPLRELACSVLSGRSLRAISTISLKTSLLAPKDVSYCPEISQGSSSNLAFATTTNLTSNRKIVASDVKFYSSNATVNRLAQAKVRRDKAAAARAKTANHQPEEVPEQPPAQQNAVTVAASEASPSELQVANAFDHPALIITRPIEWGTVILGYEQANRYTVYNEEGLMVAQIAEEVQGIGNAIGRQLLRTHRSFTATVFSADVKNSAGQQVLFRVKRPAYFVNSSMFIEDGTGRQIGELHQRFHLLKRNYDLYLEKRQFASIEGTFLAWDFELKDERGGTLAYIDRNFQGFGKEIFTDAGKYVIHFGSRTGKYPVQVAPETPLPSTATIPIAPGTAAPATPAPGSIGVETMTVTSPPSTVTSPPSVSTPSAATSATTAAATVVSSTTTKTTTEAAAAAAETATATASTAAATTATATTTTTTTTTTAAGPAGGVFSGLSASSLLSPTAPNTPEAAPAVVLERRPVARPMEISERLMALACAIAIDYDYFSQHSHSGGWMPMPIIIPGSEPSTVEGAAPPAPGAGPLDNAGMGGAAGAAGSAVDSGTGGGFSSASSSAATGAAPGAAASNDMNLGGDSFPGGSSTGSGFGSDADAGFKWDDLGKAADSGAGGDEESGGILGIAKSIFGAFFGDGDGF